MSIYLQCEKREKIYYSIIKKHKMKKLIVSIIATVLFSSLALASQKTEPQLKGRVMETVNGQEKPVQFAYVYCEGTTISAYTNENGEFTLPVDKVGKYTLRFSHAGYAVVEKDVKVKKHSTKVDYSINRQDVLLTAL
jgi:hypothetical protein